MHPQEGDGDGIHPEAERHQEHAPEHDRGHAGERVRLTEAPWCRVFHHLTEK